MAVDTYTQAVALRATGKLADAYRAIDDAILTLDEIRNADVSRPAAELDRLKHGISDIIKDIEHKVEL